MYKFGKQSSSFDPTSQTEDMGIAYKNGFGLKHRTSTINGVYQGGLVMLTNNYVKIKVNCMMSFLGCTGL
jgi:hypothetical protein